MIFGFVEKRELFGEKMRFSVFTLKHDFQFWQKNDIILVLAENQDFGLFREKRDFQLWRKNEIYRFWRYLQNFIVFVVLARKCFSVILTKNVFLRFCHCCEWEKILNLSL